MQSLARPGGQIAYSDTGGSGPLVLCVPGIGEVRATWRHLTPLLTAAGFRVVAMDLRGQGESSASFFSYAPEATGADVVALLDALHVPSALLVGNSLGAAAAVWAAAERPAQVGGLALLGPFVRDVPVGLVARAALHVMLVRPWGPSMWGLYYKSLYKGRPPPDLAPYTAALVDNLRQPGRFEAVAQMVWATKAACARRLPEVRAKTVVVMGSADPDFDSPMGEATYVAAALQGRVVMAEGAGHYPQVEQPQLVADAIVALGAPAGAAAPAPASAPR